MNYEDFTSRRCPSCHHLRCSPDCPENDDPREDEEHDDFLASVDRADHLRAVEKERRMFADE